MTVWRWWAKDCVINSKLWK